MILITTAGKVGSEAARLLAQQGEPVRVLVRDPAKSAALVQAGAEVAEGDLEVPATIDAAMKGVSAVVLVSPAIPAQELNVVGSAARAGVGHVAAVAAQIATAPAPHAGKTYWPTGPVAILAGQPAPSSSSPPTTPRRSRDADNRGNTQTPIPNARVAPPARSTASLSAKRLISNQHKED
jgi:uncharacterized protein YbjT (DUF2867 family)